MERSLDIQRAEYSRRRLMAMPLAGTVAWAVAAAAGLVLEPSGAATALFVATGSIVYLGRAFSKLTGENLLDKSRPKNAFDALFLHTVAMSLGGLCHRQPVLHGRRHVAAAVLGHPPPGGLVARRRAYRRRARRLAAFPRASLRGVAA